MGKPKQIIPISLRPEKKGSTTLVQANPKVYRNQPCTCGSGKKKPKNVATATDQDIIQSNYFNGYKNKFHFFL